MRRWSSGMTTAFQAVCPGDLRFCLKSGNSNGLMAQKVPAGALNFKMDAKTVKKELEELGKKYNLHIKELDKELELIDTLAKRREFPEFPLRIIRRRLVDIHLLWINYLHSFIFPNPQSIVIIKEAEAFDDKEKDEIYKLMVKFAKATRESVVFEIKRDDEKEAEFIKTSFENFKKIKKQLEPFAEKNIEFWRKESEKDNE